MVDYGPCSVCGGQVLRDKPQRGNRPKLCSPECKKTHLSSYYKAWSEANKQSIRDKVDANREQVRAWNRAFYARHRERRQALRRAMYQRDPEKALAASKAYAKANPDVIRRCARKSAATRRAAKLKAFVEAIDPQVVFDRDRGICGICLDAVLGDDRWEIDHIVPLSRGGHHAYDNVQVSHRRCNRSKGNRVPELAA